MPVYPVLQHVLQKDEHFCCDDLFARIPNSDLAKAAFTVGGKLGDSEPRFSVARGEMGRGLTWVGESSSWVVVLLLLPLLSHGSLLPLLPRLNILPISGFLLEG